MKSLTLLNLVLLLPELVSAAICNNNCGRQVAGTARQSPPFASRSSWCAEFVTTYVGDASEPEPTFTVAAAAEERKRYARVRRQGSLDPVITGTKPAYATSCPDVTAYWSACQCIDGITATTISGGSQPTSVSSASDASTTTSEDSTSITLEPSSTIETSSTSTSSTASPPTCTPGLEFAIYVISPSSSLCSGVLYSSQSQNMDLKALLEGRFPDATGLTPGFGNVSLFRTGDQASLPIEHYGVQGPEDSTFECNVVDHRGYIEVTTPGNYTVISQGNDDVVLVWVGDDAESGAVSASNSDIASRCCSTVPVLHSFTVEPFDGPSQYIPYRILYGNAGGPGEFGVRVVSDAGSSQNTTEPLLVASCTGEGDPAPAFLPWEDEIFLA
ncbi:uncharacterized protein CTRU02_200622 [Colletotrichum truncatum]|uniref:Uncharacterized protein n=1 Tax=Colletotrichum truncatum TaxID=5467 RepID=A0ACC3ZF51_COLTU|nr:uncharacterized protein CTRU02_00385 [Colletotrichum truncatum]KAF6801636.1 hypothetical protein CTRU02_00385 [Colletotrichum truncatum]